MPTVHVLPSSDVLLQDIADSLSKSKKVITVTGAGISTNSGIPDFRSENGLYSLIQAQFDATARTLSSKDEPRDGSPQPTPDDLQERPAKRLRVSPRDACSQPSSQDRHVKRAAEITDRAEGGCQALPPRRSAVQCQRPEEQAAGKDVFSLTGKRPRPATADRSREEPCAVGRSHAGGLTHVPGPSDRPPRETCAAPGQTRPVPGTGSLPNSTAEDYLGQDDETDSMSTRDDGKPLPESYASSRASTPKDSQLSSDLQSFPFSSSPLSSPPPVLYDPYEELALGSPYLPRRSLDLPCSSQEDSDTQTLAENEGDPPSSPPLLASQSSFASSVSSLSVLPNIKGRDLFDSTIWRDPVRTSVFYTFTTTLRQKVRHVTPTASHQFLSVLRDCRKLVRCYTQNIDQLEERVGLATSLGLGPGSRTRFSTRSRSSGAGLSRTKGNAGKTQPVRGPPKQQQSASCSGKRSPEPETRPAQEQKGASYAQSKTTMEKVPKQASPPPRQEGLRYASQGCRRLRSRSVGTVQPTRGPSDRQLRSYSCGVSGASVQRGRSSSQCGGDTSMSPDKLGGDLSVADHWEADEPSTSQAPSATPGPGDHGQELTERSQPQDPSSQSTLSSTPSTPDRGVECVFLHGSLDCLRCFVCSRTTSWDEPQRELDTLAGRQPACPHCEGAAAAREERGKRALGVGKLRPDIVLYGEDHPLSHLIDPIVRHDLSLGPDMLLILGTSLRVHGLKVLVKEFAKAVHDRKGKVVFINYTKPPDSVWADVIDFWIQWDCDAWVQDVKGRKPAMWLPPGAAAPDDEERKSAKAHRASRASKGRNSSTAASRKKATSNRGSRGTSYETSRAGQEGNGAPRLRDERNATSLAPESVNVGASMTAKAEAGSSCQDEVEDSQDPNAAPRGDSSSSPPKSGPPRGATEGRCKGAGGASLAPNAKKPKALRDDRLNGAYVTWKIMQSLKRIVGPPRRRVPLWTSSKRLGTTPPVPQKMFPEYTPAMWTARGRRSLWESAQADISTLPLQEAHVQVATPTHDSSIGAGVKQNPRKRKPKALYGYEVELPGRRTRGAHPPISTHTATLPTLVAHGDKENIGSMAVGSPGVNLADGMSGRAATTPINSREPGPGQQSGRKPFSLPPPIVTPVPVPTFGLRGPFTPALPPAPLRPTAPPEAEVRRPPTPGPSMRGPGPLSAISSNLWGEACARKPARLSNPFFFADPLAGQLQHPPAHMSMPRKYLLPNSWGPDNQLQREQEAAVCLSNLKTRSTP